MKRKHQIAARRYSQGTASRAAYLEQLKDRREKDSQNFTNDGKYVVKIFETTHSGVSLLQVKRFHSVLNASDFANHRRPFNITVVKNF